MKLNCAYRDTDGFCLKYSTYNRDVPCLGNRNCDGFAEDFGEDASAPTNADHIRSMTDEELAKFLADEVPHGDCYGCQLECSVCEGDKFDTSCRNAFYKWLKQPYKEEV